MLLPPSVARDAELEHDDQRGEIRGGGRSLLLSLVGLQLSAAGLVVTVSKLV